MPQAVTYVYAAAFNVGAISTALTVAGYAITIAATPCVGAAVRRPAVRLQAAQ